MTSLAWGPIGHCTSGRPLNPPLLTSLYVSTTVDDAALAADRLAVCLADMGAWLKASRLRLNPTKTQVMLLGSQQMLARLDIDEMPVLSSTIPVQQSARLLSAATTASSRPLLVDGCHQDDGPGVYHQSPGLM